MKKTLITILLGISVLTIYAQEPQNITENFFQTYQQSGSDAAIDYIISDYSKLSVDSAAIIQWKNRLTKISSNKENYCGYEILETTKTGNSIVEINCLVKYEKAPIIINMIYYKPQTEWQLISMQIREFRQTNISRQKAARKTKYE